MGLLLISCHLLLTPCEPGGPPKLAFPQDLGGSAGLNAEGDVVLFFSESKLDHRHLKAIQELARQRPVGELILEYTIVAPELLVEILRHTELKRIVVVGRGSFDDSCLAGLARNKSLRALILRDSSVTDQGLQSLVGLEGLTELCIRSSFISDAGCAILGRLKALRSIHLIDATLTDAGLTKLVGIVPKSCVALENCPSIKAIPPLEQDQRVLRLVLKDCNALEVSLASLNSWESLESLEVVRARLVNDRPRLTCPHLSKVSFRHVALAEPLAFLESLPALRSLTLEGHPVTRDTCQTLLRCASLTQIELLGFFYGEDLFALLANKPQLESLVIRAHLRRDLSDRFILEYHRK